MSETEDVRDATTTATDDTSNHDDGAATEEPHHYEEFDACKSILVLCPFTDLANLLAPFDAISKWGCSIVQSCSIENTMAPTEIGVIRSVFLESTERVAMREKMVELVHSDTRLLMVWETLPCNVSPYPKPLCNMRTTLTATPISEDTDRCFVEMRVYFTSVNRENGVINKTFIEEQLLRPLVQCLAEVAIVGAYDTDPRHEEEYFTEFKSYETQLAKMKVDPQLPPEKVLPYEKLFASWVGLARRERQLLGRLAEMDKVVEAAQYTERQAQQIILENERRKYDELNAVPEDPAIRASAAAKADVQKRINNLRGQGVNGKDGNQALRDLEQDPEPTQGLADSAKLSGCAITTQQIEAAFVQLVRNAKHKAAVRAGQNVKLDPYNNQEEDDAALDDLFPVRLHHDALSFDEVLEYWQQTEHYGLDETSSGSGDFVAQWMTKHNCLESGMKLEHFSLFMLQLSQR